MTPLSLESVSFPGRLIGANYTCNKALKMLIFASMPAIKVGMAALNAAASGQIGTLRAAVIR